MKIAKNKTKAIAIAIFLMLSIAASMILVPNASAHTPAWSIPTFAYIVVAPNPVGVGQSISVYMWLDKVINSAAVTNDVRFHNYNLTITKPDGAKDTTIFATCQDTTSSQYIHYTPDQVGSYTFTFTFPGQVYTYTQLLTGLFGGPPAQSAYINDTYLASSASTTLNVQQEPIPTPVSSSPMPTAYWTRPIFGLNTDWWAISSNWLGTGSPQWYTETWGSNTYVPGAVGSQTSHIMWTKPLQAGGVVGGTDMPVQGAGYFEGSAYLFRFSNPIILDGKLYYKEPRGESGSNSGPLDCVNLQTGQLIWSRTDVPSISFGYIYSMWTPDYHGVWPPILVAVSGTTWRGFDGDTGDPLFNATGVPSGTKVMGPSGEYLLEVMANAGNTTNPDWRLCQWNSSKLGNWAIMGSGALTGTLNASTSSRYDWNVSIPWRNTMTGTPTVVYAFYNDMMLCYNYSLPSAGTSFYAQSSAPYTWFAVNLNADKGPVGSVLWRNTLQPPAGNVTVLPSGADPKTGVFAELYKETMNFVGYSMTTGQKLWGPTPEPGAMDYYGNDFGGNLDGQFAYGNLYSCGFGGVMYCYNDTTGQLKWTYGNGGTGNSTNAGYYNPYGDYPTMIVAIGNGVIYTETTEHTATDPIYRGALTRAINATDGTEVWTLLCYGSSWNIAIADGFTTMFNGYDNQIYTVGRGPSATTVTAPDVSVSFGTPVVIKGSVTDISAGTKQNQQAADFPNGVACASDASMTDWMGYVYQQQPLPTNFAGVQVTIDVLDSNFNYRTIGSATTDASGKYSLTWTPDIAGNYTVIASFAGTNGYWPSYSENSFNVMEAPPATPTPTPAAPLPPIETYFVVATVAIIIAIAIVGLLILRKRP
jgi:hypothetical protein